MSLMLSGTISSKYTMTFISEIEVSLNYRMLGLIVIAMKFAENSMIPRLMQVITGIVTHLSWLVLCYLDTI